jgi:serine/threonine protein kinase
MIASSALFVCSWLALIRRFPKALTPGIVLQRRYRIKRLLARGGMGAVYEAEAVHLRNAIVAVKETFFSEDRLSLREQFEREAATLARLRHPALPQVKDHFIEGGGQFLVDVSLGAFSTL